MGQCQTKVEITLNTAFPSSQEHTQEQVSHYRTRQKEESVERYFHGVVVTVIGNNGRGFHLLSIQNVHS